MVERLLQNCVHENAKCEALAQSQSRKEMITQRNIIISKQKENSIRSYLEEKVEKERETIRAVYQIRKEEYRTKQIEFMEQNLNRKIVKRNKHTLYCNTVMEQLLDLVEMCSRKQQEDGTLSIQQRFWSTQLQLFVEKGPGDDEDQQFGDGLFDKSIPFHKQKQLVQQNPYAQAEFESY